MKITIRRPIQEVSSICGIEISIINQFIDEEWVNPIDKELVTFDEEDVCRILLIYDLREKFGVNDESVPVILHLIDQLNFIIHNSTGGLK
ncbi:MAG: chaperone modulator CbpM [Bdellovibrionales bacterium]|nr:chaperone modulator CbpM [Bdellovibrionales bacterium]